MSYTVFCQTFWAAWALLCSLLVLWNRQYEHGNYLVRLLEAAGATVNLLSKTSSSSIISSGMSNLRVVSSVSDHRMWANWNRNIQIALESLQHVKVTQYRRFMSSFDGVLPYDAEFFNLRAMKFVNFSMGLNNRSRREAADGGETQRRDSEAGLGRSSYIEHHQTCSEDFRRQTSACSARRQRGCHQFAATSKYVLRFCAPLAYHFILLLLRHNFRSL